MIYAEAAYFDGYHFAHIAARDEQMRLAGLRQRARVRVDAVRRATPRLRLV